VYACTERETRSSSLELSSDVEFAHCVCLLAGRVIPFIHAMNTGSAAMQRPREPRRRAALTWLLPPLLLLVQLLHLPHCCSGAHGEAGATLTPAAVALSAEGAANASEGRCPAWHTENTTCWHLVCGSRSEVEPPHSGA
jgi:hypothetical protein